MKELLETLELKLLNSQELVRKAELGNLNKLARAVKNDVNGLTDAIAVIRVVLAIQKKRQRYTTIKPRKVTLTTGLTITIS